MAKSNLTTTAQITTPVREIDFVTRFAKNWDALMQIMGIMRPIKKTPGTKLVASKASIVLQDGNVGEGEEIPYSQAKVEPVAFEDITLEKYAKAVSIEAVDKYGAAVAVQKTDDAFLNELQNKVLTAFYTFLKTGTLTATETSWQRALAMAKGAVLNKFQNMRLTATEVVGFVNILDYYNYLGDKDITIQTESGLTYVKDFLGYRTLFLLSDTDIDRGMIIAVPVENIDLYYIDPSNSDFAQLGLNYTVEGVTNLIGFHADGNYNTAVGEVFALMGMKLWAEYLDGIAVYTVSSGGSSGTVQKVSVVGPVSTIETAANITTVTLNKESVEASDTAKVAVATVNYNIKPITDPTLTYLWQVRAKTGTVWTNLTDAYTGYNTAELTVKAADAEKHYRCRVAASGSGVGSAFSNECTVQAAG